MVQDGVRELNALTAPLRWVQLNTHHPLYPQAEDLWHNSFVKEERRDDAPQQWNVDNEPLFHPMAVMTEEDGHSVLVAILFYWQFDAMRYVEHFAVVPCGRSKGWGTRILQQFVQQSALPVVLEVERPDTVDAKRRICFYRCNGFCLWNYEYWQPPYRETDEGLPLCLMSTEGVPPSAYALVADVLHRKVYHFHS